MALQGYDPVAFYTEGKPVKGDSRYQANSGGGTSYFASAEHRDVFQRDPAKDEPQFGGFCAWAVSRGYTARIEVETGQIIDGRPVFNYRREVQKQFDQDRPGNLARADRNWPRLLQEQGRRVEAE